MANTSTRRALESALAALDAARAAVGAALAEETAPERSGLLDARQTLAEYGIGRDGLLAAAGRGELVLNRGARQRILVSRSELERWIRSRRVTPRKRSEPAPTDDLESWQASELAELRAMGAPHA